MSVYFALLRPQSVLFRLSGETWFTNADTLLYSWAISLGQEGIPKFPSFPSTTTTTTQQSKIQHLVVIYDVDWIDRIAH